MHGAPLRYLHPHQPNNSLSIGQGVDTVCAFCGRVMGCQIGQDYTWPMGRAGPAQSEPDTGLANLVMPRHDTIMCWARSCRQVGMSMSPSTVLIPLTESCQAVGLGHMLAQARYQPTIHSTTTIQCSAVQTTN
jgi:hypothetical protein